MILVENKFGHGGLGDKHDARDYKWSIVGKAVTPYDWSKPYDIEEILSKNSPNFKLPINNQGQSFSCGGQAWSKYGEVLSMIYDGIFDRKSAKFIYAQTNQPGGGSWGRDNCKIVINEGWGNEIDTVSYENGNPPSEKFMITDDITPQAFVNAKKDEALSYVSVDNPTIDTVAQAVFANYGAIIGILGQNNGTWLSPIPEPPKDNTDIWGHWLYAGKLRMNNGKKEIGVLNSWGASTGESGWQWITEDYFNTKINNGTFGTQSVIQNVWTMVYNATPAAISNKPANWLTDLITRIFSIFS